MKIRKVKTPNASKRKQKSTARALNENPENNPSHLSNHKQKHTTSKAPNEKKEKKPDPYTFTFFANGDVSVKLAALFAPVPDAVVVTSAPSSASHASIHRSPSMCTIVESHPVSFLRPALAQTTTQLLCPNRMYSC